MRKLAISRFLSLLLTATMLFSLLPASAIAVETGSDIASDADVAAEVTPANEDSSMLLAKNIGERIDAILTQYGITAEMTDSQIANAIAVADEDALKETMDKMDAIEQDAAGLTEEAFNILDADRLELYGRFCSVLEQMFTPATIQTVPLFDGLLTITDTQSRITSTDNGDGTYNVTIKSQKSFFQSSAQTNTITIKNASTEKKATISFSLTISSGSGTCSIGTGDKEYTLDAEGSTQFTLTSGDASFSTVTTTIVLQNLKYEPAIDGTSVTLTSNDSNLGSISSSITATNGVVVVPEAGVTLTATAGSGKQFVAWVDANNNLLSIKSSFLLAPTSAMAPNGSMTAKAIFATTTAWFLAGGTKLYDDLNAAVTFASSASRKVVVLMNNGTLPQGTYSITNGVTLLVPYAAETAAHVDPLTDPERIMEKSTTAATGSFRKLTVASGAVINCAGHIRLDAVQVANSTRTSGQVYDKFGQIQLNKGASLNMNSGSSLRAYGYITGEGTVNSTGAAIYELFQITDWRGGNVVASFYEGMEDDSFLISQFYVQNIEAKLVVDSTSTMTALVAIAAGLGDKNVYSSQSVMVGSGGMFVLNSGTTLTRTYTGGRIHYAINGNAAIGSITLTIDTGVTWVGNRGVVTMNSSDYVLNLPSNMTVEIVSGTTTFPVRAKLLPNTVLQVDSGAELAMSSGAELIVYDYDDWTSGSYTYGADFFAVQYSVGTKKSSLANTPGQLIVNGTLRVDNGAAVYSTNKAGNNTNGNNGLTGSGKIVLGTAPTTARTTITELIGNNSDTTQEETVAVTPLQALLKGISTSATDYTHSMANSRTYYGSSDNYWYNYVVNTDSAENRELISVTAGATSGDTVTPYDRESISNALGYVAYNSSGTQSQFSFGLTGQCITAEASNATVDGTYSLTAVSNDSTITISPDHQWVSGICSVCGDAMIKFDKISLSIQGQVRLNLKFIIHEDVVKDNVSVTITEEGNNIVEADTWTVPLSDLPSETKEGGVTHYVVSQGIAAGEMTGEVTVVFKDGDTALNIYDVYNKQVHEGSLKQTVLKYAERGLASGDDKDVALCTQMVIYGGYAQQFFGVDTGYPAYSILGEGADIDVSEAVLNQTATISDTDIGITATTQKINLDSAIYMRTYFVLEEEHTIDEYTFTLTDPDGNSRDLSAKEEYGRYYVDITNIPVAYWNDDYTITVTNDSGTYTVNSSVLAWAARCVNQSSNEDEQNMARAMYFYCEAADKYFANQS